MEALRGHAGERGSGLGTRLFDWAVEEARRLDRAMVRLASGARRFYERLGLVASHVDFETALRSSRTAVGPPITA